MNLIKEHHHTLLVTLFLLGALLVAGSFEARLPDTATAASTPGQQSVTKSAIWNSSSAGVHNNVIYTGEIRRGGALIKSDDVLKPGDKLSVKFVENASFFLDGSFNDSPPSPCINQIVYRDSYACVSSGPFCNARSFEDSDSGNTKIVSCDSNEVSNCNQFCEFDEGKAVNCTSQCSSGGACGTSWPGTSPNPTVNAYMLDNIGLIKTY